MRLEEMVMLIGFIAFGLASWICGVVMTHGTRGQKLSALLVFCGMVYLFAQVFLPKMTE